MSNVLAAYNPIFYANEALTALHNALGMARGVYRGLDDTNTGREKGDTITIRVPGAFTAQDAPSSAQDIGASNVSMVLNIWKEVKFALTDKELAFTQQQIIKEHVLPATYAIANKIDQLLFAEYVNVPWSSTWTNTALVADITTGFRKKMFLNKVNFDDPSKLHAMLDGATEGDLLALQAFSQYQGAGPQGVDTQVRGYLGQRYGFNFMASQNIPNVTSTTIADLAGAFNNGAGYAAGITTGNVDGMTVSVTIPAGSIMVVTGHTQQYVLTADLVLDGGGAGTATWYGTPFVKGGGLEAAVLDNAVVTFQLAAGSGGTKDIGMAFHEGAIALGVAKLPDFMNGQGVMASTATDPDSNLSIRCRTWADGNNSKYYIAFDFLGGVKTLDGNKACRLLR